jgi:Flp pilus assembly protein TadG
MEVGVIRIAGKFASLIRKSIRRSIRRSLKPFDGQSLARDIRGSEIAEAALVMPLTFMIMLGIFWFGQAFRIYGTIAHAARQGARAAAAQTCTTCAAGNTLGQNAINAVQTAMTAAHLDPAKATWPTTVPVLNSCVNGAAVPCDPASTNVCVQGAIQLSNTGTGAAGVCGVSVSFQYPYQFWFPGTSLNKQLLQLPGVARMSMEAR